MGMLDARSNGWRDAAGRIREAHAKDAAELARLREVERRVSLLERDSCNGSFVGAIVSGWLTHALKDTDDEWARFTGWLEKKKS